MPVQLDRTTGNPIKMKPLSKEEILQFLGANKKLLQDTFGVIRIGIFGSFAQDRQTPDSDIDIIVELQKDKKNIHTFFHLKRYLEKHLNRKIDLGFETSLKPAVHEKVQKDILYA